MPGQLCTHESLSLIMRPERTLARQEEGPSGDSNQIYAKDFQFKYKCLDHI